MQHPAGAPNWTVCDSLHSESPSVVKAVRESGGQPCQMWASKTCPGARPPLRSPDRPPPTPLSSRAA